MYSIKLYLNNCYLQKCYSIYLQYYNKPRLFVYKTLLLLTAYCFSNTATKNSFFLITHFITLKPKLEISRQMVMQNPKSKNCTYTA